MDKVKVACIQMNTQADIDENLKQAENLIREAASHGAQFITTPENTDFMAGDKTQMMDMACDEASHPAIPFFTDLAKELEIWLLIGSLKIKGADGKLFNRSYLFDDKGECVTQYNKIHLFDVDIPNGESHRESDHFIAGECAKIVKTPWGKMGLSICYDVRFADLYRKMAQVGVSIICVPAAFTAKSGEAHWETLLRARAIETGSFVIAAAQGGDHPGGRKTHGHSMIIDPWGKILAEQSDDKIGFITSDINLKDVDVARSAIPSLHHDKEFTLEEI